MVARQNNRHRIIVQRIPWQWNLIGASMGMLSYITFLVGLIFFRLKRKNNRSNMTVSNKVEKVLIVRLDGMGDLVMTFGFLKAFRRLYPKAWIVLLIKKDFVNIVELCPYVDEIQVFNGHYSQLTRLMLLPWCAISLARHSLSSRNFDLVINPRWGTDANFAGFLTYFVGAKKSLAFSEKVDFRKKYFNRGFDRLYTTIIDNRELKHECERGLDVIRFLNGNPEHYQPEIWLSENDCIFAETLWKTLGKPFFVTLVPGAGTLRRMWPLENFLQIGSWLMKQCDAAIIVLGNAEERKLGNEIVDKLGEHAVNMAGYTTLRQAAAILGRCKLFVGNDSGLMHIASAVGTPIVEISCHPLHGIEMDWNSPIRFGAWSSRKVILQPDRTIEPCVDRCEAKKAHCIKNVSIQDVQMAIESLLNQISNNVS